MSKDINANRDLPADQVIALFRRRLPNMLSGIGADREWLWWAGPKPDEETRQILGEMGWRFSGKPHELEIGGKVTAAHWYHSCGGTVVFRRRARPAEDAEPALPKPASPPAEAPSAAVNELFKLLNRTPK